MLSVPRPIGCADVKLCVAVEAAEVSVSGVVDEAKQSTSFGSSCSSN